MQINAAKSNTIVFTERREAPPIGILYGKEYILQTDHVTHLGIRHDFSLSLNKRIDERLQKARNSFYAMSAKGVNAEGVNPLVSVSLYAKITKPVALYGSELWCNLSQNCINKVDRFQHFIVKQIQGFKRSTRSDMCESMLGLHKLHCDITIRKFMFLYKLLTLDSKTISRNIFLRRFYSYLSTPNVVMFGFIPDICALLYRYGLLSFIKDVLTNPALLSTKCTWKRNIKGLVYSTAENEWIMRLWDCDDFECFRKLQIKVQPSMVYKVCKYSASRKTMHTIARVWCRKGKDGPKDCTMCSQTCLDTLIHAVSDCEATKHARQKFLSDVSTRETISIQDLTSLDNETFALCLLGAPVMWNLSEYDSLFFLQRAFTFICECVRKFYGDTLE